MKTDGRTYGVDPGTHLTAVSYFDQGGGLIDVRLFRSESSMLAERVRDMVEGFIDTLDEHPSKVAVEVPRIYPKQKKKVDPEDIIRLTLVAGGFLALGNGIIVRPQDWKRQIPKDVCQRRIKKRLRPGESRRLEIALKCIPRSLRHNAWDAVGIGMDAVGRKLTE